MCMKQDLPGLLPYFYVVIKWSQTGGRKGLGMRLALTSRRSIVFMWLSRTGAVNCISRLSDIVVVTAFSQ